MTTYPYRRDPQTGLTTATVTYTFKHGIQFKDGHEIEPSYSTSRKFKTIKGALKAGERFSQEIDKYYTNVSQHVVIVVDQFGAFVTNMAC